MSIYKFDIIAKEFVSSINLSIVNCQITSVIELIIIIDSLLVE